MSFGWREDTYLGNPVFEVLVDGQPWGITYPHDEHFRFGFNKAHMIVAARGVLAEFFESNGTQPVPGTVVARTEVGVTVTCEVFGSFTDGHGVERDNAFVRLTSGNDRIGLGRNKIAAVLALQPEILGFLIAVLGRTIGPIAPQV